MGPFPLQLAQRYVAPHRVHYRSLSLTIAAKRSAAVVEMPFNCNKRYLYCAPYSKISGALHSARVLHMK